MRLQLIYRKAIKYFWVILLCSGRDRQCKKREYLEENKKKNIFKCYIHYYRMLSYNKIWVFYFEQCCYVQK